ncbi:transposase [Streptomyces sp. NPDC014991]|uniref:transposase n=1 Tax=Streptomyces sp. NPDC014991 TaxID=3364935 RepID=UPI0036FBA31C
MVGSPLWRGGLPILPASAVAAHPCERHTDQAPVGVGPGAAVILLITVGDNPGRPGGEASFAALCGVSPVERSSGRR